MTKLVQKAFGKKIVVSIQGTATVGGKTFFARSMWEYNIACYLEFLKTYKQIIDWEHEPETFWFHEIKRGVRSYLPDFKVTLLDGTVEFWEVKGFMDSRSKTKISRFAKYYPQYKLQIINKARYTQISDHRALINGWGLLQPIAK